MKIGFLITARLKSSRLKLKLLKRLNGYTVIERVIQRAKIVEECDDIVLCTSADNQDLPLVRIAKNNDIYCFNGDAEDVLKRLNDAASLFNLDFVIGITADNPLFSIRYANIIADMIRAQPDIDFIYSSGNPVGMNIYALNTKALKLICEVKEQVDTEIWGSLVNRPELFNVIEVPTMQEDIVDIERLTLDEDADYRLLNSIFNCFDKEYVIEEYDIKHLLETSPELKEINAHIKQLDLSPEVKEKIDTFFVENKELLKQRKEVIYGRG